MIVLSAFQAEKISKAIANNKTKIDVSLDLGLSLSKVEVDIADKENIKIILTHETNKAAETEIITLDDLKKIIKNNTVCFLVKNSQIHKIQLFSAETNTFLKLFPTGETTAPTIELSGIRMHNIKDQDAITDAKNKIAAINVHGKVLDTCFGQGYTAIIATKKKEVIEIYSHERDPNIVEIAKHNPWSAEVFTHKKIKLKICDTVKEIKTYKDNFFDAIIHDPPMFKLSQEMYSSEFYSELFRVLKKGGEIYHYTGAPGAKNRSVDIAAGVIKRFQRAGFKDVVRKYNGVAARK
ncbi:methyltransferase [Candidatus Woesearchaeota archaeon]|nr:methyltransferase [Candidatus Woesearchaeota archaeon]